MQEPPSGRQSPGNMLLPHMDVGIAVLGEGSTMELHSLHAWLLKENELRGRVHPQRAPVGQGEMGALVDALIVALGSSGAITVLARSLETWLRQPRRTALRLKVTRPDGSMVEFAADHIKDIGQLEPVLRQALRVSTEE
jgi:hypothetical protein